MKAQAVAPQGSRQTVRVKKKRGIPKAEKKKTPQVDRVCKGGKVGGEKSSR